MSDETVYDNPNIIDNPQKENDELYQKLIKINENNMIYLIQITPSE